MALTRQVITSLLRDGTDALGTKTLALKIIDESIVSGSLLTVESNHFCVLKSRGAVLNVYETGQYALTTPDKPIIGSIVTGFFGGTSPWVYEVIYINRSKLLVRSAGVATSAEMAEMAYQVDYYIHVDTKEAALDLITHMPFAGTTIDTQEISDYAGPAIEQGDQPDRPGDEDGGDQRAHHRHPRIGEGAPDRVPRRLRHHAERPEGPDRPQGRADARADQPAGDRPDADRGGALLSRAADGREGAGVGPPTPPSASRSSSAAPSPACRSAAPRPRRCRRWRRRPPIRRRPNGGGPTGR